MNRKTFYIAVIVTIALISVIRFAGNRTNPQNLLTKFNSQLKEERFEEMYDDSAANAPLNVSKEVFVERMKEVVKNLKSIDKDLNFQFDAEYGHEIGAENSPQIDLLKGFQTLDKEGKSITMGVYWNTSYFTPKLYDFFVIARNEISEPYESSGVAYSTIVKR